MQPPLGHPECQAQISPEAATSPQAQPTKDCGPASLHSKTSPIVNAGGLHGPDSCRLEGHAAAPQLTPEPPPPKAPPPNEECPCTSSAARPTPESPEVQYDDKPPCSPSAAAVDSVATSEPEPETKSGDDLKTEAIENLRNNSWACCIRVALLAVKELPHDKELKSALLVARILLHSEAAQWHEAMGLDEGSGSDEASVRQQYKKMAVLVHPDKCSLPHAAAAFKALQEAMGNIVKEGGVAGDKGGSSSSMGNYSEWMSADLSQCHGFNTDSSDEENEGDIWKREREMLYRYFWDVPSTEPAKDDDEIGLWLLTTEELASEVRVRQAAVLMPSRAEDVKLTPHERQKRLRVARAVLSERMGGGIPGSSGQDAEHAASHHAAEHSTDYETAGGFVSEDAGLYQAEKRARL